MTRRRTILVPAAAAVIVAAVTAGCSSSGGSSANSSASSMPAAGSSSASGGSTQAQTGAATPGPKESNPSGDIPDNQAYVAFQPTGGGFTVKVPEGWARTTAGASTTFNDKLNRIAVAPASSTTAPTPASVTATVVPALSKSVPGFTLGKVSTISRKAGQVVLLTYHGNSAADPVTGKVVPDSFERYAFFRSGHEVDLTLSGPVTADNVDPWRIVSDSFSWR